jgi:hypothetical protein
MAVRTGVREFKYTKEFLDRLFGDDLHAKRVHSLANATLGVMTSASLAVCTIGHGLALARGGLSKHAIKQEDRLLSNPGIDVKDLFMRWVPSAIGSRKEVEIAEGIARMADRRDDHLSKGEHAQQKRSLDKLARAGEGLLCYPLSARKKRDFRRARYARTN